MVLYLVGLGMGDEKDITVRGLELVKSCSKLFLEHYTSVLGVDKAKLEEFYGKPITMADRFMVESSAETIYHSAVHENVALLVVGDPLCATTHTDMMIRAREIGAKVEVIHNASVMGAVASCGLQLYQFGQTVSVPFFHGTWRPDSWYDKCQYNAGGKMHTLVLLDIKVKEPDFDAMALNQTKYLPPRFMTVNQAAAQLLEVEEKRGCGVCGVDTLAIGLARLGQPTQHIVFGTLAELLAVDFGPPLHSLVLCGEMHELELEFLAPFKAPPVTPEEAAALAKRASAEVAALVAASESSGEDAAEDPEHTDTRSPPTTEGLKSSSSPGEAMGEAAGVAEKGFGGGGAPNDRTEGDPQTQTPRPASGPVLIGADESGPEGENHQTGGGAAALDDDDVFELCGVDLSDGVAIVSDDED